MRCRVRNTAPSEQPFHFVVDDPSVDILIPNTSSDLQILVYVAGLDSAPLPSHQCATLRDQFRILSICHSPSDRSDWEELVNAVVPTLQVLASNGTITLFGESFGAALALRFAAACPNFISRLVLLNPGTALEEDAFLNTVTKLLPVIAIDRTERILYKAAAVFLFQELLTKEYRLAEGCKPEGVRWLRSVDIDQVPLQAMLHRVSLLRRFSKSFTDYCIRDLIRTPTLLLASGDDRLLQSRREIARLAGLLRVVEDRVVLAGSAHAALLEKDVNLSDILLKKESPADDRTASGTTDINRKDSVSRKTEHADYVRAFEDGKRFFGVWHQVTSPVVLGKENVVRGTQSAEAARQRPLLFVGNHSVFGILDLSVFYIEVKELLKDRRLRSLADPIHFNLFSDISGGRWDRFVTDLGAVTATPRNFYRLLSDGENILLFPGGAREVCRRRGENYQLFWKSNLDFVRPAARFDAIIIPFSAVGADDSVDILVDGQELQRVPQVGEMVKRFLEERKLSDTNLMPLASFPPRPDRFYFKFHEPMDTSGINHRDAENCQSLYLEIKDTVERGIQDLLAKRERDPERGFDSRMRKKLMQQGLTGLPPPSPLRSMLESLLPEFEL